MDFKEWFRKHEREVFKRNQGCFDTAYKFGAKQGYEAGQQSKQAEIDALKEKISKVLYAIAQSELHGDRAIWGIQDEIKEILK